MHYVILNVSGGERGTVQDACSDCGTMIMLESISAFPTYSLTFAIEVEL